MGLRSPYGNGPEDLTGPTPGAPSPAQVASDQNVPMTHLDLPGMELTPGEDPKELPAQPAPAASPDAMAGSQNSAGNPLAGIAAGLAGAISAPAQASDIVDEDALIRDAFSTAAKLHGFADPASPEVPVSFYAPKAKQQAEPGSTEDLVGQLPNIGGHNMDQKISGHLKFDPSGKVFFKGSDDKEFKPVDDNPDLNEGYQYLLGQVRQSIDAPGQALGLAGSVLIPGASWGGALARIGAQSAGPALSYALNAGKSWATHMYGPELVEQAMKGYNSQTAMNSSLIPTALQAGMEVLAGPFAAALSAPPGSAANISEQLSALKTVGAQSDRAAQQAGIHGITPGMATEGVAPAIMQGEQAILNDPVLGPQIRKRYQDIANQTQAAMDEVSNKVWAGIDPQDMNVTRVTQDPVTGQPQTYLDRKIKSMGKQVGAVREAAGAAIGQGRRFFDPTAAVALMDSQIARFMPEAVMPNGSINIQKLLDAKKSMVVEDAAGHRRFFETYLKLRNLVNPEPGALGMARQAIPSYEQYAQASSQAGMPANGEAYNQYIATMSAKQQALTGVPSNSTQRLLNFGEANSYIDKLREHANYADRIGASEMTAAEKASSNASGALNRMFDEQVSHELEEKGMKSLADSFKQEQMHYNQNIGSVKRARQVFNQNMDDISRSFNKVNSFDFAKMFQTATIKDQQEMAALAVDHLLSGSVDVGLGGQRIGMSGSKILETVLKDKTAAANFKLMLGEEDLNKLTSAAKIAESLSRNESKITPKAAEAGTNKITKLISGMFNRSMRHNTLKIVSELFPTSAADLRARAVESVADAISRHENMLNKMENGPSAVAARALKYSNRIPQIGMEGLKLYNNAQEQKKNTSRMKINR